MSEEEKKRSAAAQVTLQWRREKLRQFQEAVRVRNDELLNRETKLLLDAYTDMLRESAARLKPDRDLLIHTAARIVAALASKDGSYIDTNTAAMAVTIAREIIVEVDK